MWIITPSRQTACVSWTCHISGSWRHSPSCWWRKTTINCCCKLWLHYSPNCGCCLVNVSSRRLCGWSSLFLKVTIRYVFHVKTMDFLFLYLRTIFWSVKSSALSSEGGSVRSHSHLMTPESPLFTEIGRSTTRYCWKQSMRFRSKNSKFIRRVLVRLETAFLDLVA